MGCGGVDTREGVFLAAGGATPSISLRERELLKRGSGPGEHISFRDSFCRAVTSKEIPRLEGERRTYWSRRSGASEDFRKRLYLWR